MTRSVERPRGDGLDTLIAGTLQANGKAAGSATQQDAEAGMLIPVLSVALRGRNGGAMAELGDEVSNALRCGGGGGDKAHVLAPVLSFKSGQSEAAGGIFITSDYAPTLQAQNNGSTAVPAVLVPIAFSYKDHGADAAFDLAPTLRAGNHDTSHANSGQPPAIAFDARQDCVSSTEVFGALGSSSPQAQAVCCTIGSREVAGALTSSYGKQPDGSDSALGPNLAICITGDITHTLKAEGFDASEDGTGRGQPIVTHAIQAGALRTNPDSGPDGVGVQAEVAYTLEARAEVQCAQQGMKVRRLTPRECERLQAYPDDYTLIPWRALSRLQKKAAKHGASFESVLREHGKIMREPGGDECPDGPRYKALGNSMCTRNMKWIGERIQRTVVASEFVSAA